MKKASKKQFMRLLVVLFVMFSFSVIVFGDEGMARVSQGRDVEVIYDGIRHSAPEYEWEESIVTFENEGMTLVCSLTIPRAKRLRPIIIILNGFAGTRDEAIIPDTNSEGMLKRLARILAEHGFASLRVDFRGSGDSDGDYSMTTFSTQISDALAAVEFIEDRLYSQVNAKKIGIVGYSQGGLVGSVTAVRDRRVDSLVLWSPVSHAPIVYEGLLSKQGIQQGLTLEAGGSVTLPVHVGDWYWKDVPLGKGFFEDLYIIDPVAEIRRYKKPLMVIAGRTDQVIWPQPAMSGLYLKYHNGLGKLIVSEGDHDFDFWELPVPEKFHDAIYWTVSWFIKTL